MSLQIVGIGEILWDIFPDEARFGGAPCNFACSAAELAKECDNVWFVGAVGSDKYGIQGVESLRARGVNTDSVEIHHASTGRVTVQLDHAGVATYVFDSESAWDFLSWNDDLEQIARACDVVCFGTLGQRGQLSRDTIRRFLTTVSSDALRILDINLRAPYFDDRLIVDSIELANVLKLNDSELSIVAKACNVSGTEKQVLEQLIERYRLDALALTKGADGALLYARGNWSELPSEAIELVDTVGAGDAYTAAMALGLANGSDAEAINRNAIKVSSYVCTQPGATMSFPFRLEELK